MENKQEREQWFELYNEIIDNFSYKRIKTKTNSIEVFPTSFREVKFAQIKIDEIESLQLEDKELAYHLDELKKTCKKAIKKRFVFSPGMFITILLWVALNIFLAYSSHKDLQNNVYEPVEAAKLHNEKIDLEKHVLQTYRSNNRDGSNAETIKLQEEKIRKLESLTAQEYFNQRFIVLQNESNKKIYLAALWFVLFVAYIFSARMPFFLVYKRRKKKQEREEKGTSGNILSSILSSISSIPDDKTESSIFTPYSSGQLVEDAYGDLRRINVGSNKGMESSAGIRIFLYALVLITAFFIMIAALPLLIIFNYITNYQYKLVEKIGSSLSLKPNKKFEARKVTERVNLPDIDLKVGDEICARYSNDQFLYPAIIKETDENGATVIYTDDSTEYVKKKDICSRSFAVKNLKVQCDWESKGEYYECLIKKTNADSYQVVYKDRSKEIVTINQLRFYQ